MAGDSELTNVGVHDIVVGSELASCHSGQVARGGVEHTSEGVSSWFHGCQGSGGDKTLELLPDVEFVKSSEIRRGGVIRLS